MPPKANTTRKSVKKPGATLKQKGKGNYPKADREFDNLWGIRDSDIPPPRYSSIDILNDTSKALVHSPAQLPKPENDNFVIKFIKENPKAIAVLLLGTGIITTAVVKKKNNEIKKAKAKPKAAPRPKAEARSKTVPKAKQRGKGYEFIPEESEFDKLYNRDFVKYKNLNDKPLKVQDETKVSEPVPKSPIVKLKPNYVGTVVAWIRKNPKKVAALLVTTLGIGFTTAKVVAKNKNTISKVSVRITKSSKSKK